jgi:hypothetical protein
MPLTYYINDGALSGYSRALGVWREPLQLARRRFAGIAYARFTPLRGTRSLPH